MKYLKYYESFYSSAKNIYKSDAGTDFTKDTGFNSYPLDSFSINDEERAFKLGEKAFNDDVEISENPYLQEQYPNSTLIKKWEDGWNTAQLNKNEAMVDFAGNLLYPGYLSIDEDDNPDIAYQKGRDSAENDCDKEENPYISSDEEENNSLEELRYAWYQGWEDFKL